MTSKVKWQGVVIGIQPRINLLRSFDTKSHRYLGYRFHIDGFINDCAKTFMVGIGKGTEKKHQVQAGDIVKGEGVEVPIYRDQIINVYKVSKLEILQRGNKIQNEDPPFIGVPPDIEIYREFGHKRLDTRTYHKKCLDCIWGCKMAVEIIIDHWNPEKKQYRFETFCYNPTSCKFYKAGQVRKVQGRNSMVWEDPG